MKTLLVLRHAKSAYPDGVPDHDRPLALRGERDAAAAARWLHEHGLRPDLVVCSTATRTRQTWERLSPHFDEPGPEVRFDERVYDAPASRLATLLREADPGVGCVLLVGHNPGCEDLVLALCDHGDSGALSAVQEKYPTCGLAVMDLDGDWGALAAGKASLRRFVVPRG
jgi:phosphohistidine phosphatase